LGSFFKIEYRRQESGDRIRGKEAEVQRHKVYSVERAAYSV
jgi:hypothetical protein